MTLRLSFSTGSLYHFPLRTTFALAREAGFEGLELVLGPQDALRGPAYVMRLCEQYALPVLSVHPPIIPHPRQNSAAHMLPRLIWLAERVSCDLVVLHTPKVTSTHDPRWEEFVNVVLRERVRSRIRISLENAGVFWPADINYVLHDLARLRAFADCHDLPLTFDTAHAGTSAYELLEAYALLDDRVVNVHFSDLVQQRIFPDWPPLYTFFRHHQIPGNGVLPLAEFLRMLVARGYSDPITVELSPTALKAWCPSQVREGLVRSAAFVRQLLGTE